jgi:hypothetical protein
VKDDPTIDAIRQVRHEISAAVGHDPRKLVASLRQFQERHRERILAHPKPPRAEPADEDTSVEPQSVGS